MRAEKGDRKMKREELKVCYHDKHNDCYLKQEADSVMDAMEQRIKELEDKVQMHDFFWEGCSLSKRGFTNTIDVANYIKELEKCLFVDGSVAGIS